MTPQEKSDRIRQSMFRLVGNDAFSDFIDELRDQQRNAMLDSVNDAVLKDPRLSLAAAGEIRAFEAIISLYDDFVEQRLQQADIDAEQRSVD